MKSTFFAALAVVVPAVVYAQLDKFPSCALGCLTTGVGTSGCPEPLENLSCVCKSSKFVDGSRSCFASSCSEEDAKTAVGAAYDLCQIYSVTIETSLPEATPTETDTETTTETITETTTEAITETTTEIDTETETTPEPTITETITTPITTLITTTITGTGNVTPPTNTTNPTVPAPTETDNAAVKNVAGLSAMAMAIAAIFML